MKLRVNQMATLCTIVCLLIIGIGVYVIVENESKQKPKQRFVQHDYLRIN